MPNLRYAHSEGHTDLCHTSDFKYIITCGSEGDVRIWDGVDDANQKDTCVGEKAWAVAHSGNNLYVGTDTNIIQAYTFPELDTDGILTRFTAPVTQIDISSCGRKLVAGSCDMTIHVVDINSMECTKFIGHKAPILSVCFDPKSEFIVSSGCDGMVKIWSLATQNVVKEWECLTKSNSFESAPSLCRVHFQPGGRLLAIPLKDSVRIYERGGWMQIQTFGSSENKEFSIVKFSKCGELIAAGTTTGEIYIWNLTEEKLVKKETDDNKQAITGISWNKDSFGIVFCNISGQLGDVDVPFVTSANSDVGVPETRDLQDIPLGEPEFDDDDDDDGENVISLDKIKAQSQYVDDDMMSIGDKKDDSDDDKTSVVESVKYRSPVSEPQPPFQPSSTPVHLQQRFMLWNCVGIVRQFNSEDLNDIDVEFHDTTSNYGVRLNNVLGHTMAALTSNIVVLACPRSNDDSPSKMVCVVLKSWDGQKEWDCTMPELEEITGVAAGDHWVAAAIDNSILRIFSIDGSQTDIFSIPGKFVSMVGYKSKLTVIFHTGIGIDGEQHLSYCELKISPTSKLLNLQSIKPLPLSAGTKLRWVGYTDEGSLATVDSNGVLRLLYGALWRPVCPLDDQCKSKFDHYFVVGINEATQTIRCILCKGAYYPQVVPKPMVAEVKWQVPLCELESEKGKLEEEYLRYRITAPNISIDTDEALESKNAIEKSISISVMKLFALACRSDLEARAISLCEAMPTLDVVKLAAKYAMKLGRQQLAQKVNEVAARMSDPMYELEKEEEIRNSNRPSSSESSKEPVYSQDLFEETESTKENLILKLQQRKAEMSPKPLKIRRPGNPFKKEESGLVKATSTVNNTDGGKSTYMEWYSENHKRLQEEYPFMKEEELVVAGIKQFKQLAAQNSESQNSEPVNSEPMETKKRKAPSQEDNGKPMKKPNSVSKLKSFSFSKR